MLVHRQDFHSTFWERTFCPPIWRLVSTSPAKLLKSVLDSQVVVDICPHTDNGMWCPKRPGQTNTFGVTWLVGIINWMEGNVPERAWWSQTNSLHLVHFAPLRPAVLFPSFCLFASSCCTRSTTTSTLPQFHLSLVPRETLRSVVFTASQPQSSELWQQKWHDRMLHRSIPVLLSFDNFYFQFDTEPCDKEMQSGPYSSCRAHICFFIFSMPFMRSAF